MMWLQYGYVKNQMNFGGIWQLEVIDNWTYAFHYQEWAIVSFSEFGICGNHRSLAIRPKENIDPLSDGKMNAAILGICKFLHSGLSLYEAPA